ncbi:MAG: DHH family phosphoesterase, partial [Chloroflexota bacterium]
MTEVIEPAAELVAAAELLRGAHRIAILSHVNPDADAIGSTLGLTGALESMGKEVTPALADEVPVYARFLEGADRVVSSLPPDAHFDVLLIADAADIQRIGALYEANPVLFQTTPILNLDHHGTNPLYGKVNYVVPSASSSSELSFNLLSCLGAPIGRAVATSLLFGIFGDTGAFQNGATTPSSMDTAASLIRDGADNQKIAFQLFERKTFEGAKLWGMVIAGITLDKDRRIVFGYMS